MTPLTYDLEAVPADAAVYHQRKEQVAGEVLDGLISGWLSNAIDDARAAEVGLCMSPDQRTEILDRLKQALLCGQPPQDAALGNSFSRFGCWQTEASGRRMNDTLVEVLQEVLELPVHTVRYPFCPDTYYCTFASSAFGDQRRIYSVPDCQQAWQTGGCLNDQRCRELLADQVGDWWCRHSYKYSKPVSDTASAEPLKQAVRSAVLAAMTPEALSWMGAPAPLNVGYKPHASSAIKREVQRQDCHLGTPACITGVYLTPQGHIVEVLHRGYQSCSDAAALPNALNRLIGSCPHPELARRIWRLANEAASAWIRILLERANGGSGAFDLANMFADMAEAEQRRNRKHDAAELARFREAVCHEVVDHLAALRWEAKSSMSFLNDYHPEGHLQRVIDFGELGAAVSLSSLPTKTNVAIDFDQGLVEQKIGYGADMKTVFRYES